MPRVGENIDDNRIYKLIGKGYPVNLDIRSQAGGVILSVKVVPGASRTQITGFLGTSLKVQIAAAPKKGRANKELIRFLAGLLDKPKSSITIVSGHKNPHKEVKIKEIGPEELLNRLGV